MNQFNENVVKNANNIPSELLIECLILGLTGIQGLTNAKVLETGEQYNPIQNSLAALVRVTLHKASEEEKKSIITEIKKTLKIIPADSMLGKSLSADLLTIQDEKAKKIEGQMTKNFAPLKIQLEQIKDDMTTDTMPEHFQKLLAFNKAVVADSTQCIGPDNKILPQIVSSSNKAQDILFQEYSNLLIEYLTYALQETIGLLNTATPTNEALRDSINNLSGMVMGVIIDATDANDKIDSIEKVLVKVPVNSKIRIAVTKHINDAKFLMVNKSRVDLLPLNDQYLALISPKPLDANAMQAFYEAVTTHQAGQNNKIPDKLLASYLILSLQKFLQIAELGANKIPEALIRSLSVLVSTSMSTLSEGTEKDSVKEAIKSTYRSISSVKLEKFKDLKDVLYENFQPHQQVLINKNEVTVTVANISTSTPVANTNIVQQPQQPQQPQQQLPTNIIAPTITGANSSTSKSVANSSIVQNPQQQQQQQQQQGSQLLQKPTASSSFSFSSLPSFFSSSQTQQSTQALAQKAADIAVLPKVTARTSSPQEIEAFLVDVKNINDSSIPPGFIFDKTSCFELYKLVNKHNDIIAFRKSPEDGTLVNLILSFLLKINTYEPNNMQKIELYLIMKPYMDNEAKKGGPSSAYKKTFAGEIGTHYMKLEKEVKSSGMLDEFKKIYPNAEREKFQAYDQQLKQNTRMHKK